MENKSHAIIAISFLAVFSLGAVLFFFWLSHQKSADRVYEIVTTQSVGGLHSEASVKFKGLKAGKVKSVEYDPKDPNKILIKFAVYKNIPITTSTYGKLGTQGLTGMKALNLSNPNPHAKPLKTSSQHPARISLHPSLFAQLKKSGKQDMKKVNDILTNVHKVLDQNNRQHLSQTIAQVDKATAKLVKAEKTVMPALQQMPELSKEARANLKSAKSLIAQVKQLVAQAKEPVRHATQVEDSIQSLSQSANRLTRKLNQETLPRVNNLTQSVNRALDRIDRLTNELQAKPQSVIFGPPKGQPGPGEPGFQSSQRGGAQ